MKINPQMSPEMEKAIEETFKELMEMPSEEFMKKLEESRGGDIAYLYEGCDSDFFETAHPSLKNKEEANKSK